MTRDIADEYDLYKIFTLTWASIIIILPAWAFLLILTPRLPGGLRQDATLCNEYDVLSTELFFKFPHQSWLNFLIASKLRNWHRNNDGLLVLNINFLETQKTI